MAPKDPNLTVQNLLDTNWTKSNTNSTKPDIHTGEYRDDSGDPQVAVLPDGETPMAGGETGYAAIDPTGAGGIQELDGIIACQIYDNYGRTNSAKDYVYLAGEEVARIIMANQLNQDDLRVLAPGNYQRPVVVEREPTKLQATMPVQYVRDRRP